MARKGPSELTKHEVQLLTIAAKFMAAMKRVEETGLSPMELDIMDTKINQEVRTINSIFAGYGIHSKTPRVHPIIQVIGTEWQSAAIEDRYPDWFILMTEYITTLCEYVSSENLDWHLKLSSLDLNSYLDGLHPSKMWWLEENTIPQMPSESTVDNLPSQSSSSRLCYACTGVVSDLDGSVGTHCPKWSANLRGRQIQPRRPLVDKDTSSLLSDRSTERQRMADKRGENEQTAQRKGGRQPTTAQKIEGRRISSWRVGDTSYSTYTPAIVKFRLGNPNTTILGRSNELADRGTYLLTRSEDRPADAPSKRHTAPYALRGTKRNSPGNPGEASETRTDAGDIVAYGNDHCGPCIHFGDAECKAQANKRSIACVKCAQRHKPCEPPATWAIPLHHAMEARSTPSMGAGSPGSFGDSRVDALECKVESLTLKLGDVTQTVDRVLFEVVNTRQDSHDTRLMVGKLLSHQGIKSTSIPGVGMPPTNRRSVSPGVQSTSSVGAHMSGLTLSDIRPPSSLSSAPPSRSCQPSGESIASGGRLTPSGISGGSSSAGPVA
ncbi:hypothetical protein H4582DRAFT_2059722 [Lactarius indigo]|nr:hypothetical protein H4582DRAFT_2059722 [Lactarius indigo]